LFQMIALTDLLFWMDRNGKNSNYKRFEIKIPL